MARIEDYALIGDLQTAALVSHEGSIDWCCFPRFDSGACFAALLGNADHGRWLLAPATTVRRHTRRYRTDTLILESIFETDEGPVRGEDLTTVSEFTLRQGERIPFMLTWFPSHKEPPEALDSEQALKETETYWLDWANLCNHQGDYHDEIHQSLLVLKALTYAPTGGNLAAPTTSLPE
jgi:GH15 family glucan-1,4-alpha-glucosidase